VTMGNTSSSLESNIIRYGEIIGTKLFHKNNNDKEKVIQKCLEFLK